MLESKYGTFCSGYGPQQGARVVFPEGVRYSFAENKINQAALSYTNEGTSNLV